MKPKTYLISKLVEAVGIAALMVGFVQGVYGDMWGELYLFIGGIVLFIIGRRLEKNRAKRAALIERVN